MFVLPARSSKTAVTSLLLLLLLKDYEVPHRLAARLRFPASGLCGVTVEGSESGHVYTGVPRLSGDTVWRCLYRREQACKYHFSEPKRVGSGDVTMSKALTGSQVFCQSVRAAHDER